MVSCGEDTRAGLGLDGLGADACLGTGACLADDAGLALDADLEEEGPVRLLFADDLARGLSKDIDLGPLKWDAGDQSIGEGDIRAIVSTNLEI